MKSKNENLPKPTYNVNNINQDFDFIGQNIQLYSLEKLFL
jgi:hypothetical protein